ncbi:MAG: division/cell wall cluster transcriptional repressor MraZ [Actinomycetes bacterium]
MAKGFEGSYQHSPDAKGRVVMPVDFRVELADGCHVAPGLDRCVTIYPEHVFAEVRARVTEAARRGTRQRNAARAFIGNSRRYELDKQGRVPVPVNLRELAGLDREVVVVGIDERIEIWDAARWREQESMGLADLAGSPDLADLGII